MSKVVKMQMHVSRKNCRVPGSGRLSKSMERGRMLSRSCSMVTVLDDGLQYIMPNGAPGLSRSRRRNLTTLVIKFGNKRTGRKDCDSNVPATNRQASLLSSFKGRVKNAASGSGFVLGRVGAREMMVLAAEKSF